MKRLPLFGVVALLGAAVSAPAQFSVEARIADNVRGSVTFGEHAGHRHAVSREPVRRMSHAAPFEVRGHWETICEQVLVPGCWREEHVPPTYGWVYGSCGHRHWDVIDRGGCRRIWVPAHYETCSRRIWVGC
jgi:hypothetical protein